MIRWPLQPQFIALICVVVLVVLWFIPLPVGKSAQVAMTPVSTTVDKSTTWTSDISVRTNTKINAVDITITFPADILDSVDVNTEGSDFGVTVFKPKIDNQRGTIRFVQAIPQGYVGGKGHVATITFKANKSGKVQLGVGAANLVAADGKATNVYQPTQIRTVGELIWDRSQDLWR